MWRSEGKNIPNKRSSRGKALSGNKQVEQTEQRGRRGHEEGDSGRGQIKEEFVVYHKDLLL